MHRIARTAAVAAVLTVATAGTASAAQTHVVVYKGSTTPDNAAKSIKAAGGTVVADYRKIGVVIVRSSDAGFQKAVSKDGNVDSVAPTAGFGVRPYKTDAAGDEPLPNAPATDDDNLSPLQWDMRQIKTPEAHAVTGGSPEVVVGDLDTGLDFTHPDIAPNYDAARSADCSSGAPTTLQPGNDAAGHGTHTAGTIAAAANGTGIVGVAPNVKIAGIKTANDEGFFFPEMVVCAFMWAGNHGIDVTNNSYFADPYLFNCRNDKVQGAIWKAETRAIKYAQQQGVTVVASEGNESTDLSHPEQDNLSPDTEENPDPRPVNNACRVVPVEVPGVIGVTAVGNAPQSPFGYLKSYYSSYGVSTADVTAPGGDRIYGVTAEAPNGRVLSTWPSDLPCARQVTDPETGALYCYLQGTSMAGPHVAGVAALIISARGRMAPSKVESILQQTADAQPCPDALPAGYLEDFPQSNGDPQSCQGGIGHNSWYGAGQVNALRAVTG